MGFYTAYLPPPGDGEPLVRAVVARDGFSWPAFLLTGFWLLYKRMWAVLLLFLLAYAALVALRLWAGLSPAGFLLAQTAIGLLVGLEGQALWGRKLMAGGWRFAGVVEAPNQSAAERRFFEHALAGLPAATPAQRPASARPTAVDAGVIGVFPGVNGR